MRLRALIPVALATMLAAPAAASAALAHVVAPGESLSSVAASDGLTVDQLASANGFSPDASLLAGSTLMIPSQTPSTAGSEASVGENASSGEEIAPSAEQTGSGAQESASSTPSYVVQPGDTLTAIAARAGTSVTELAAANGIDPNAPLLSGAVLTLSGASTEAEQSGTSGAEAAQVAEGSSSAPPYPTAETVTPSEVGSIAVENGVSPSLAEAIAYQESGFNNELTSSADARGVMQILPGTWNWISNTLASTPLAPASAASNVRGGVLLLHSLLSETGGDSALAAAGYYQGLSSVLQEGQAPSTEQYVGDVLALQQQFGGE
jgi:LysM repeat protein